MNVKNNLNLSYCYAREMNYWETIWNQKDSDIATRLDESRMCHCPDFVINTVEMCRKNLGRTPRVMDFGCGPFSNINYLHKKDLAELVGVDVLADEYKKFYERYQIDPPIPLVSCSGEGLSEEVFGRKFDFVFVQNALDHTASPLLTWLNLYKITENGGYLGHCHAIREGTYQNKDQLHQYDMYPEGNDLIIDDLDGQICSLIDGLDLEIVSYSEIEVEPDKRTGHNRPNWFYQIYRKIGVSASSRFLNEALENLKKSFIRRSDWAIMLERTCLQNQS